MKKGTILGGAVAVTALVAANTAVAQERPTYELPAIEVEVLQTDLHQHAIIEVCGHATERANVAFGQVLALGA